MYKNFDVIHEKCNLCFKKTHLSEECDKIHYIPNKDFLVKKLNYSTFQIRQKKSSNCFRLKKRINALSNITLIQSNACKYSKNTENESFISEYSLSDSNDSQKNVVVNPEKSKTKPWYPSRQQSFLVQDKEEFIEPKIQKEGIIRKSILNFKNALILDEEIMVN